MKKSLLLASAFALTAALVPVSVSAMTEETTQSVVTPEYREHSVFYFENVAPGRTVTDTRRFDVTFKQHLEVDVTSLSSASAPNANLYLVDLSTGVAVRGPIKLTNTTTDHIFYDVMPGTYVPRLVNNGSSTITLAKGLIGVDY